MTEGTPLLPTQNVVEVLDSSHDEAVAHELVAETNGSEDEARQLVAALRADPAVTLHGIVKDRAPVAVIAMRKASMANEIALLVVAPEHRGQGLAKRCLSDALRRSGRRPLTVEADEACAKFYKACGFKIVGRRPDPDGGFRYRLGWHAPTPRPTGPQPSIPRRSE
jgi:GNAT superfamily N-acetyltransferase